MQNTTLIDRVYQEDLATQRARLRQFRGLLEQMFDAWNGHHTSSVPIQLLFASVLKVHQAASAADLMAGGGYAEEILALSYTSVEVIVNAAYFQCTQAVELDRYLQFEPSALLESNQAPRRLATPDARQSGLRGLVRALFHKTPAPVPEVPPANWTSKSVLERAHFSDVMSAIPVMSPLVQRCFTRGLAAVHGAFDALDPFVSRISREATPAERAASVAEAVFRVNLCLYTLCTYLNAYLGLGMEVAIEHASTSDAQSTTFLAI